MTETDQVFFAWIMVRGLKQGDRVQATAKNVLGLAQAKRRFKDDWETKILQGKVIARAGRRRSVTVQWSCISKPHTISTRMLQKVSTDEEDGTNATIAAAAAEAAAADANTGVTAAAADRPRRKRGRPRRTTPVPVMAAGLTDDEMEEIPVCNEIDSSAEEVEEEDGDDDEDEGRNVFAHGLIWHGVEGDITVDQEDRAKMLCRLIWRDGLQNDRSPLQYFMHLYPHTHLTETLRATNANFEDAGISRKLTRQEYFVFVGLIFACSLYPNFSVQDMFNKSSGLRRTRFLLVPNFSVFMCLHRFNQIRKHMEFSVGVTNEEAKSCSFWQVQPLVDAFNHSRQTRVSPGYKMVVDESMSEWRGKDQRHGDSGCPHVTKIIRKPKGVGMEIKNMADCDSGMLMALEIMAGKHEMKARKYAPLYGSGTSLLLRLSEPWKGSGRLIVADSAFASVKSAVALKVKNGLYFHGLVKTAHRRFPKKYLNEVKIDTRGGHVALETSDESVDLRAVTWNDGKKDKKTGMIVRKNFVASCGTTLAASTAHRKRRWRIGADGRSEDYFVTVPRPQIVQEYFDGAAKIDIHNHFRQGRQGVALEQRGTMRWDFRFYQTILGMVEVDSFLAYRRFCPHRATTKHVDFLRVLVQGLLDNTIGCAPDAPVLRPRPGDAGADGSPMHSLRQNRTAPYFIGKAATAKAVGKPEPQCILRCRVCGKNASYYCPFCSSDDSKPRCMHALCGPKSGRTCFEAHQQKKGADDFPEDVIDLI